MPLLYRFVALLSLSLVGGSALSVAQAQCPTAVCDSVGVTVIWDLEFKTQLGTGSWPPSFAPFIPDAACGPTAAPRGYRYRTFYYAHDNKEVFESGGWRNWRERVFLVYGEAGDLKWRNTYGQDTAGESYTYVFGSEETPDEPAPVPGYPPADTVDSATSASAHSQGAVPGELVSYHTRTSSVLSSPVRIKLNAPEVIPTVFPGSAYKHSDGRYQALDITGHVRTCPGKYEYILVYTEQCIAGGPEIERRMPPEEFEITPKDLDNPRGKKIETSLPTTEDTKTVFVRLEYRPKPVPSSAGSGGESNGSITSSTSLGRLSDGSSAGHLFLHQPTVVPALFSALGQTYHAPATTEVNVVHDTAGALRQIRAPDALVDITPLQVSGVDSGYEVALYTPAAFAAEPDSITGLYLPVGSPQPFLTIAYENPDAPTLPNSAATRLRITRQHAGAAAKVTTFENLPGGGTAFEQGNGLLRIVETTTTAGADSIRLTERYSPATATSPDSVESVITRSFPFGARVVEEARGTGAAEIYTTYHYDTASASPTYGLLLSREESTGAWERYEYDSNQQLVRTWRPLGDAPPTETAASALRCTEIRRADVTTSVYGAGELGSTLEFVGGVEVFRSHHFVRSELQLLSAGGYSVPTRHEISVRATRPGDAVAWDDSSNEFNHAYKLVGGDEDGETFLEVAADGSATFRLPPSFLPSAVAQGLPDRESLEVWRGVPNATLSPTVTPTNIIAGTRSRTITALNGQLLSEETRDIAGETSGQPFSGYRLKSLAYDSHDASGRPQLVVHLDGSQETREYSPCCGQLTKVSHRGITTTYGYDALGRREWEKVEAGSGASLQVLSHTTFTYDSQGHVLTRSRVPYTGNTPGTAQLLERNVYDAAGTLLSVSAPGSLTSDATLTRVTTYASSYDITTGRITRTVTLPGGATEITVTDRAGRTLSRTGTAVAPVRYEYGTAPLADAADWGFDPATPLPFTREVKLDAGGADTLETVTTYSDFLGRNIKTVYGDGAAARSFYDLAGRLVRQTDPDGVQTLHTYTPATATTGEVRVTALDMDRDGVVDYNDTDRVTRQTGLVSARSGYTVQRVTTEIWETDANATATTVSVTESTPNGLRSWQTAYGLTTASVTTYNTSTGERTDTVTLPDNTSQVRISVGGRPVSETRRNNAAIAVNYIAYGYDAFGRPNVVSALQDAGSPLPAPGSPLVTTTTYYADDQAHAVTTPDPDTTRSGPGYDPQTTTYAYDAAGRLSVVSHPDGTSTWTGHWPTGAVKRTWSGRTYRIDYTYDAQGRLKTLATYQNFGTSELLRTATTRWNYSSTRGWLINKRYTDNTGPDYDYYPSGRLKTRDWARSVSGTRLRTSYAYNNAGDLASIDYADATPDVTNTYDRLGRLKTTTDAAGALTRTYQNGRLDDETYTVGSAHLSGLALTRTQGAYNRPATLGATSLTSVSYGYDNAGRLGTITQGSRVATFGYKTQVGTHQSTAITVSGTARYAMTRATDALGRISRADTVTGPSLHTRRDYTYNAANQRTEVVHEDDLRWAYGYDALGQVTSAQKRDAASLALPGYDHSFLYDTIGNRVSTTTNGRLALYTSDLRNQYVSRTVPAAFDVVGSAPADVNLLIEGEPPARSGQLFHSVIPVNNAAASALESVEIIAANPGENGALDQIATETRSAFVAATPESYTYDLDGNLTQDGRWTYIWDAENRLVQLETRADVAQASGLPRQKLVFAYDAQGRRIRKQVYAWAGGAWAATASLDLKFLYDGWNLLAEYNASNVVVRSHVWGIDLSGIAQGAGGVGGLLWTTVDTAAYSPGYDANGNIIAWVDVATGTVTGRRDYGAFGETAVASGNAASLPFAFSTKYRDSETELYYYGFRYYNPSTGRWLSRDPIEENGGLNLYGMVGNDPANKWDALGLDGGGGLGFPDDGWTMSPSPPSGNPHAATPAQRWFFLTFFTYNPLSRSLLSRYMDGHTTPDYVLTESEMVQVGAYINIRNGNGFSEYLARAQGGTPVRVSNMMILTEATAPGTLGSFFATVNGDLTCGSGGWEFSGRMTYADDYDFNDRPARGPVANGAVALARWGIPGLPFHVSSVEAAITQKHTDDEAQWAGTGFRGADSPIER